MSKRGTGHRQQTIGFGSVVALCLVTSVFPILAPRAPTEDDPGAVSVERALEHVEFVAQEPHVMGTPEIERVREYLIETLTGVGLEPETLTVETPDYFGAPGGTVDVTDVLVRIPGSGDGEAILFMAHYDTVPSTPGANDNSTAVAALLEVGRVLASEPTLPNDVILLFTDGEEPTTRFGAWGFAEYHPWFADVALAVNLEGVGVAGPTMLVEMSGSKDELILRLTNAAPDLVAFSFMTQTADLIGGPVSDFDVFRDAGVPGYNFTYMRGVSIYHTSRDAIDVANVNGLAHDVSLSLGIARNFGSLEIGNATNEAVFFTAPFGFVVRYSATGAIVSLAAALLLLVGALWSRVRRRGTSVRRLLSGLGLVLLGALGALVVATVVWIGLVNLRSDMGVVEGYAYLAALIGLTGGAWYLVERRSAISGSDPGGGLLITWLVLAVVAGAFLPAFGYLFVWPAIAAGVGELLTARNRGLASRLASVIVVALVTFVVLVPAVDTFFHFASPRPGNPGSDLSFTIVVPLFLSFLAVGLIAARVSEGRLSTPTHPDVTAA